MHDRNAKNRKSSAMCRCGLLPQLFIYIEHASLRDRIALSASVRLRTQALGISLCCHWSSHEICVKGSATCARPALPTRVKSTRVGWARTVNPSFLTPDLWLSTRPEPRFSRRDRPPDLDPGGAICVTA